MSSHYTTSRKKTNTTDHAAPVYQLHHRNQHHSHQSTPAEQRGFSVWVLLIWVAFAVLTVAFFRYIDNRSNGTVAPIRPEQTVAVPEPPSPVSVAVQTPVSSYHDAVAQASGSVVNIYTTQRIDNPYYNDPMFRQFLEYHGYNLPQNGETNLGSGVVVSSDGYIITNAHVIERADEIVVALSDGRKAVAQVIGSDVESDLAVIRVQMSELTPIAFRQSNVLVGDVVLAIGNPFGVGQTVTQGIVSATGRTGLGVNTFEDFIQTDAAINPGNSGGALVDATGQLVGINTMIYSRSGGSMGIGFAIKASVVQTVMNDIIRTGSVKRGWLGIEVARRPTNPTSLENPTGVEVANVVANGSAQKAGIQVGDIITAIDGTPINDPNVLIQTIAQKAPNSTITISIERANNTLQLNAVLDERPNFYAQAQNRPAQNPNQ